MLERLLGARSLAPALLLALAACDGADRQGQMVERQLAADPPQLWLAETIDGPRVTGAVMVCADAGMRAGFQRASAEVGGEPCVQPRAGVEKPGLFATRCLLNGRPFALTVNRAGEPDRDFTVRFALKALDGTDAGAVQVRRFRRIGDCPPGWRIGDQARPGARPGHNALEGTWGA